MDLFLDSNYKRDSENKLNYFDILHASPNSSHLDYSLINAEEATKIVSNEVLIVFHTSNIDGIHLVKDSTKEFCHEIKIGTKIKKFIMI